MNLFNRDRTSHPEGRRAWPPSHRYIADALSLLVLIIAALLSIRWVYQPTRTTTVTMDQPRVLLQYEGLYRQERFTNSYQSYRWTNGDALMKLPNPGGRTIMRLTLQGGPSAPTSVQLRLDRTSFEFVAPPTLRVYAILVPPSGSERMTFASDSPTVEVNGRELGIAISDILLTGGGMAPAQLSLALVLATIGGYTLLRRQNWRWATAAGAMFLFQGFVTLGVNIGGWQIGWFSPILLAVGVTSLAAAILERRFLLAPLFLPNAALPRSLARDRLSLLVATLCLLVSWLIVAYTLPMGMPLSLTIAAIGGYVLLRWLGWAVRHAVRTMVLLQGLALVGCAAYGWRMDVFNQALLLTGLAGLAVVLLYDWRFSQAASTETPAAWARRDSYVVIGLCIAALCVRLPWLTFPDPVGDLKLSAQRLSILHTGGLTEAYTGGIDYLPLRLYILYGLSLIAPSSSVTFRVPLPPETLVVLKIPALLADLATVVLIYHWCRRRCPAQRAAAITALYSLAPPIWINVAWWGQVDALLMLPLLGAVVLLDRADGRWGWLSWVTALLIKAQAVVLTPLLVTATLRLHGFKALVRGMLWAAMLLALASLPLVLAGQGDGLRLAYSDSVGRFTRVSEGAYNLWYLVVGGARVADSERVLGSLSFRMLGLILVGIAALLISLASLRRSDRLGRAEAAAALMLAFFMLPTQIHERYLFLSLAFLALCIAEDERFALPYVILVLNATLNIFGDLSEFVPIAHTYIESSLIPYAVAITNLLVLIGLMAHLLTRARQPGPAREVQAAQMPLLSVQQGD